MKKFIICFISLMLLVGCKSIDGNNNDTNTNDDIESTYIDDKKDDKYYHLTIYMPDDNLENIISKDIDVEYIDYDTIFNELKNAKLINENCTINQFKSYEDNGVAIGVLDCSKEFYDFNLGSSGELFMLDSVAKTYLTNLDLDKFKLLVDGKEYESGHIYFEADDYFTIDNIK